MQTESSYRFERNLSPEGALQAQQRLAYLLKRWGLGEARPPIVDIGEKPDTPREIRLPVALVEQLGGLRMPAQEQRRRLEKLGFRVRLADGELRVRCPPFRRDVQEPADLVEDLLRLAGYDHIPERVSSMPVSLGRLPERLRFLDGLRAFLRGAGFLETLTLPLTSPDRDFPDPLTGKRGTPILNPLTRDMSVLRSTLLVGALRTASYNQRRDVPLVPWFEVGTVFPGGGEEWRVLLVLPDPLGVANWETSQRDQRSSIYRLKALVEQILLPEAWQPGPESPLLHPYRRIAFRARAARGYLAEVHPQLLVEAEVSGQLFVAEIQVPEQDPQARRAVVPPSPYPEVLRDLSLLIPEGCTFGEVWKLLEPMLRPELQWWFLFDVYRGPGLPEGFYSITLHLRFGSRERTLSGQEVDQRLREAVAALKELGVRLRA